MPEKTIRELEFELESLRSKDATKEAQKRGIELANEIFKKIEDLDFYEKMHVLRIVVAMANNTWNREVSLTVAKS